MSIRALTLGFGVIAPGLGAIALSGFYLFPEWVALDKSYRHYQALATAGADLQELAIAEAAENRHRINCFAEGVGVLLGGVMVSIGIHGLCMLPERRAI